MNAKSPLKTRLASFFRGATWSFKLSIKLPFFLNIEFSLSHDPLNAANDNQPLKAFNDAAKPPKRVA